MKKILIPTDFTIGSLNIVSHIVAVHKDIPLKIVLFHVLDAPFYPVELLFAATRNKHHDVVSEKFKEACEMLKNKYNDSIKSIRVKFSIGATKSYVKSIIEAEGISAIYMAADIELTKPSKRSADMLSLLPKLGLDIEYVQAPVYLRSIGENKRSYRLEELINSYN